MLVNSKRYLSIVIAAVSFGGASQALAADSDFSQGQIYALESALYGAGYGVKKVDGVLDKATLKALKKYQKDDPDLMATGRLNVKTLASLGIDAEQAFSDVDSVTSVVEEKSEVPIKPEPVVTKAVEKLPKSEPVAKIEAPAVPQPKVKAVAEPVAAAAKVEVKKVEEKAVEAVEPEKEEKSGWFW